MSSGGGYGGGGGYGKTPMTMIPIGHTMSSYGGGSMVGGEYGGDPMEGGGGYGGGSTGGAGGGYGAASQAYAVEMAPMMSHFGWGARSGNGGASGHEYAYEGDQYASGSNQMAFVDPARQSQEGGSTNTALDSIATEASTSQQGQDPSYEQASSSSHSYNSYLSSLESSSSPNRGDLDYPTSGGVPQAALIPPSQIASPVSHYGDSAATSYNSLQSMHQPIEATFELPNDNNNQRRKRRRRRK